MSNPVLPIEYKQKIDHFIATFSTQHKSSVSYMAGRVFDKVYTTDKGNYMVARPSGIIYGIKSWNQHNPRRVYGTLDTVDQWDWSVFPAVPKAGTDAVKNHLDRESKISAEYKKRGRPKGVRNKKKTLSSTSGDQTISFSGDSGDSTL
jgi:hypothetical protein